MSLMDKAKLAQKALKLQKELKRMQIEAEAGDGEVVVTAGLAISQTSMSVEVQKIYIKPEAAEDLDRLSDLIAAAVNQANKELMAEATEKMQEIAGSMNLPGI
ncbi:YbaB/EbfC family nucleoid-associated protein [Candidatus Saccharibacteria bacterium]|nr:YbaB/EbfC family nucleoid-associated protein [Candidatus Saccharibacteria bacterium]